MKKLSILFIFITIFTVAFSTNWEDFYRANESEITTFISYNHGKLLSVFTDGIFIDIQGSVYQVLTNKNNQLVLYSTGKSTESYHKDNSWRYAAYMASSIVAIIIVIILFALVVFLVFDS